MTYKKWVFKALHTDTNMRKRDEIMSKLHTETCKMLKTVWTNGTQTCQELRLSKR